MSGSKTGLKTKADTLTGTTNAEIAYSSCAIQKALQAQSTITLLRSRGWTQLF